LFLVTFAAAATRRFEKGRNVSRIYRTETQSPQAASNHTLRAAARKKARQQKAREERLAELGASAAEKLTAADAFSKDALRYALDAGDDVTEASRRAAHGDFGPWLERHGIARSTATLVMRLARGREIIEAKLLTVSNLSLQRAAQLVPPLHSRRARTEIDKPKPAPPRCPYAPFTVIDGAMAAKPKAEVLAHIPGIGTPIAYPVPEPVPAPIAAEPTVAEPVPELFVSTWMRASPEARREFLAGIGLDKVLAAMPPDWIAILERRITGLGIINHSGEVN
jgi:hypothetical protein